MPNQRWNRIPRQRHASPAGLVSTKQIDKVFRSLQKINVSSSRVIR